MSKRYVPLSGNSNSTSASASQESDTDAISYTDYELSIIQHYQIWGWVRRADQSIIDNYNPTYTEEQNNQGISFSNRPTDLQYEDEGYQFGQYEWQFGPYTDETLPNASTNYYYR